MKLIHLIRSEGNTTGKAHLRLWHHLGLILKRVSGSFITNILNIWIFTGLERFEIKIFGYSTNWWSFFSFKHFFYLFFLLLLFIFINLLLFILLLMSSLLLLLLLLFLLLTLFSSQLSLSSTVFVAVFIMVTAFVIIIIVAKIQA